MKKFLLTTFIIFSFNWLFASEAIQFEYNGSQNYSLVERTDLRRYENGKYVGLTSREVRSFIACVENSQNGSRLYDGNFYVSQDTVHFERRIETGLHESIPSVFKINPDGKLTMIVDNGYPSFRSFPAFSSHSVNIGDKWQSQATRCVDPLNKGVVTRIPMYVEYTYLRDEEFRGTSVYVLSAKWATRYGGSIIDRYGDSDLVKATGSNNATMFISKITGASLVVRDSVDETFLYADGKQITYKGTISLFTEYPPNIDRTKIIPALQRVALIDEDEAKSLAIKTPTKTPDVSNTNSAHLNDFYPDDNFIPVNESYWLPRSEGDGNSNQVVESEKPKIDGMSSVIVASINDNTPPVNTIVQSDKTSVKVDNTSNGIRLTLENLHFKADSQELLPGETEVLDKIALVLKEAGDAKFLVEGHTANTGNVSGENTLSIERAKSIANELVKRGINGDSFICKGSGSTKPIADNYTKEGMAKNRRVEITILES